MDFSEPIKDKDCRKLEAAPVLDSSLFSYRFYADDRVINGTDLFIDTSGQLLVAADNKNGNKYLVEHTYPHRAANAYAACWLAEKLGVPAPKAWLLSPNPVFASKYAVAIEFIEESVGFEKTFLPEELKEELFGQFAFHALIGSADRMRLRLSGGHIYACDFSEAFYFDNDMVFPILLHNKNAGREMMKHKLDAFRRYIGNQSFDIPKLAEGFQFDREELKAGMIAAAKRVLDVPDCEIRAMTDELMKGYPAVIAAFYEECIRSMQDRMIRF